MLKNENENVKSATLQAGEKNRFVVIMNLLTANYLPGEGFHRKAIISDLVIIPLGSMWLLDLR